jgi:hypothetical protein
MLIILPCSMLYKINLQMFHFLQQMGIKISYIIKTNIISVTLKRYISKKNNKRVQQDFQELFGFPNELLDGLRDSPPPLGTEDNLYYLKYYQF